MFYITLNFQIVLIKTLKKEFVECKNIEFKKRRILVLFIAVIIEVIVYKAWPINFIVRK